MQTKQTAGNLAMNMMAERYYVDRETLEYDPRYLVFEYLWTIMLRKSQLEMVGGGHLVGQCDVVLRPSAGPAR
jgi:hypothetical protein